MHWSRVHALPVLLVRTAFLDLSKQTALSLALSDQYYLYHPPQQALGYHKTVKARWFVLIRHRGLCQSK